MLKQDWLKAARPAQLADNGSFIVTIRETIGIVILGGIVIFLLVALERAHWRERELLRQRIQLSF